MATKTNARRKGAIDRAVESAAEAAEELGAAVIAFRESWDHVRKAQAKGELATRAAARTAKRAMTAVKRGASKMRGSASRATARTKASLSRRSRRQSRRA